MSDSDEEWAFDCQPMDLLFGEPPSFHGDRNKPYQYPWPKDSAVAHLPDIRLCLPDSSDHLMAHFVWEVLL